MSLVLANSLACDLPDEELVHHARFVASVLHGRRLMSRELDELEARRTWPSPEAEPVPVVVNGRCERCGRAFSDPQHGTGSCITLCNAGDW